MFEAGIVIRFRATHHLKGDFGSATVPHGHNYRVAATCRGPQLREDGTLCDIALLERAVRSAVDVLQLQDLNTLPAFQTRNSTMEVVAEYLFQKISGMLPHEGVATLVVRVWESPWAYGSFEGALS